MTIKPIVAAVLACCSLSAFAKPNSVPADLQFKNKPIDALCFNDIPKDNLIKLDNCGVEKEKYTIKDKSEDLIKKGYIGFNWQDPSGPPEITGASYYKFFAAGKKQFWLYTINNGGGSGDFTSIYLAERVDANTLRVTPVTSGDRCNGGVLDVEAKNGKLAYSVNLTAYDLTTLASENLKDVKAYDDLAACAVCCVANAYYQVDTKLKPTLNYVQLGKVADIGELPEQGKYQACFNQITMDYMKKDQLKWDAKAIDAFVKTFNNQCVKTS
jgi:hypothetical protein